MVEIYENVVEIRGKVEKSRKIVGISGKTSVKSGENSKQVVKI